MSLGKKVSQTTANSHTFRGRLDRFWGRLPSTQRKRHSLVGPPNLWKMKRDFQYNFLLKQGLKPTDYLCDFGCGTLRGGLPLIAYLEQGRYTGIDSRAEAIQAGLGELIQARLIDKTPTLLLSRDVANLSFSRRFDVMWAFSVFMHLKDEILNEVLGFAARQSDVFYANVILGSEPASQWREFPVVHRTIKDYEIICAGHGLAVENIGPLSQLGHLTGDDSQDQQSMLRITKSGRQGTA